VPISFKAGDKTALLVDLPVGVGNMQLRACQIVISHISLMRLEHFCSISGAGLSG
jgi:hypothetical protein